MKKKVLFMLINMNVGGTEKAFLNMISEMPKEKFDLTILLLEEFGEFLDSIPQHAHVEYLRGYHKIKDIINQPLHYTALSFFKSGKWITALTFLLIYLLIKIKNDKSPLFKYVLKNYQNNKKEYDLAVAYAGPMDFISYFIINKIRAKNKIQWIHFDITKIGFDSKFCSKLYKKFDKVFVVSEEGKNKLIQYIPSLKSKIDTFYNIISPKSIEKMAEEGTGFTDDYDGIRILTVGRLTKEKGQDITIPVLKRLKTAGYNVRWYCIGDGNSKKEYELLIEKAQVKDDFILLGSKTNPYPFMKHCDLYVQPSRHEGYCITLSEAKNFNKAIVSTDFTGAREQIIDNQSGFIVNFDENQMYNAIKRILDDQSLKKRFERNSYYKTLNSNEIEKLLNMV